MWDLVSCKQLFWRCIKHVSIYTKIPGLIWLCKNCVDDGKRCLKEGSETLRLLPEIGKKLNDIEAKLIDSKKTSANLSAMLEKEIEAKFELFESKFESKMNAVLDNQGKLPSELKTVWAKNNEIKPQKLKVIMQETLAQQEERVDQEYRENNLILYEFRRVP